MIQGGGFTTGFQQKPTRAPIPNEADNGLKNLRGTIAMARTADPGSATAQFFINVKDNPALDYRASTPQGWGYAVFGKVVEGMDTVDKIRKSRHRHGWPRRPVLRRTDNPGRHRPPSRSFPLRHPARRRRRPALPQHPEKVSQNHD
jgi:cyclophilin family peptidyl-prolyl cis-trans isomerase